MNDRDIVVGVCPAGQCSTDSPAELVQGAIARRSNGAILSFEPLDDQGPDKIALQALHTLCNRVHGATFRAGGGSVDAFVASEQESVFKWDEIEIKAFLNLQEDEKLEFISVHEETNPGISAVYRKV